MGDDSGKGRSDKIYPAQGRCIQVDKFSIKLLVATLDPERPYSTAELANYGLRVSHAGHLEKSGLLRRLGPGVYQLPGGQLDRDKCLVLHSARIPGLHVGGKQL